MKMYENECNQMVEDTVEQQGYVNCDFIPVVDENNKIVNYKQSVRDTTWKAAECKDYKYSDRLYGFIGDFTIGEDALFRFREKTREASEEYQRLLDKTGIAPAINAVLKSL